MNCQAAASTRGLSRRPFILATFFEGSPDEGGGYVHKEGVLRVLQRIQGPKLRVVVICADEASLAIVKGIGLQGIVQRRTFWRRLSGALSSLAAVKRYFGRSIGPRISPVDRLLTNLQADLVFFSGPDPRALQLYSHNYIFSIWDLAHLEHPEFAEVSLFGEFERREHMYTTATRRAIAVIADSRPGARLIAEAYRIPEERIYSAPFLMSPTIAKFQGNEQDAAAVREKYGLTEPYIFYPAQFWRHKNHSYILSALRVMLDQYGWAPQAAFCGSDKGALSDVMESAAELGLSHLVKYCGFVPDDDIPYLYKGALALVMPAYFGPSNIPPMEAVCLGTPVCYSDFPSFREVMGEAVAYIDLERPASLAQAIDAIFNGTSIISQQASAAYRTKLEGAEDSYFEVVRGIIVRYQRKMGLPLSCG